MDGRHSTGNILLHFFQSFYTSCNPTFPADLENLIVPSVSAEDNLALLIIPSSDLIFKTLSCMNLRKAPRPDGMTGVFFKSC